MVLKDGQRSDGTRVGQGHLPIRGFTVETDGVDQSMHLALRNPIQSLLLVVDGQT